MAALSVKKEPITRSDQLPYQAYVTAFLRIGFFFRHILGHFFPRKWNLCYVYGRIRRKGNKKENISSLKGKTYHF